MTDSLASSLEKFRSLLQKQSELLEKMLRAAQKQNYALRRNDLEVLNEATRELAALVRQMDHQEAARQEAQRQLEEERNLPPAATLKELLAGIPQTEARELTALEKVLDDQAAKLTQLIRTNELLTRNALEFNARLLRAVAPAAAAASVPGQTYQPDGTMETGSNLFSLFDKSI